MCKNIESIDTTIMSSKIENAFVIIFSFLNIRNLHK